MGQNSKDWLDNALDQMEWPKPSPDLFGATMRRIDEEKWKASQVTYFFAFLQRPLFLVSCFTLFLCLGIGSGIQAKNMLKDSEYSYYAMGSVYLYSMSGQEG